MITESGFTYVVRYEEATYGAHFGSLDLILHFCGQMPFGIIIKDNFKISHPFGMNPLHTQSPKEKNGFSKWHTWLKLCPPKSAQLQSFDQLWKDLGMGWVYHFSWEMTQSFLPNQHHHMLQPTIYVFITVQMHFLTNLGLILPQTVSKPLWGDSFQYKLSTSHSLET